MARFLALLLLSLPVVTAYAREASPAAADPVLEQRVMTLSSQLRCLVCQNQTLADSNADLAADLRSEIREKMQQGQTDSQIVAFLVARYGDFVLYRPPLKLTTLLLWFGPLLLLVTGAWVLIRFVRRRQSAEAGELTATQRSHATDLLAGSRGEKR